MESEETHRQEGLTMPWPAPDSLLPGILARLEQRQTAVKGRSLDALRAQLAHAQWEVRAAVVRALAEYATQTAQDADTIRALMLQALQDEHRLVRVASVRALSLLDAGIPFDRLLLSLRDPDWEVREMAVLVLGELSDQCLDPLEALLQVAQQDTHNSVREAAVYALHMYHGREGQGQAAAPTSLPSAPTRTGLRQKLDCNPEQVLGAVATTDTSGQGSDRGRTGASPIRPYLAAAPTRMSIHFTRMGIRLWSFLTRYLSIFARQTPLIHKSIWFVSPLFLVLWFAQNAHLLSGVGRDIHEAGLFLALFATISAGAGTAFLYGAERDAAFELTLSTPTSLRILMLCRFVLVVGYNILLVGGASATIVLFYGGGFWDVMQLWLGPVLLISSLSLMLSITLGSVLALSIAFLLEASQSLAFGIFGHTAMLEFSFSNNWQTSPILLLLAVLSLAAALFYAPRRVRLFQS